MLLLALMHRANLWFLSFWFIATADDDPQEWVGDEWVGDEWVGDEWVEPARGVPMYYDPWEVYGARWDPVVELDGNDRDPAVFAEKYAADGVPVVLRGGAASWPAVGGWTLESLRKRFGPQVHNRRARPGEALFDSNGMVVSAADELAVDAAEADADLWGDEENYEEADQHISWLVTNATVSAELQREYGDVPFLHPPRVDNNHGPEYLFIAAAKVVETPAIRGGGAPSPWRAQCSVL